MGTGKIADESFSECCRVCGKFSKNKETVTKTTEATSDCCSFCNQVSMFLQGLICGHALCCLIGSRVGSGSSGTPSNDTSFVRHSSPSSSTSENGWRLVDRCELALDMQREEYVKTEPLEIKRKNDLPPQFEENLQISFDADCTADNQSESEHETDQAQGIEGESLSLLFSEVSSSQTELHLAAQTRKMRQKTADSKQTATHCNGWFVQTDSSQSQLVTRPRPDKIKSDISNLKHHSQNSVKRLTTRVKTAPSNEALSVSLESVVVDHVQNDLSDESKNKKGSYSFKKRVECKVCGEKFIETHLHVHMKAKHNEIFSNEETDLMFSCSECNKKFDKQSHLNKHVAKKHPNCRKLTKSCIICHKGFSNQIGLSVHMRRVHKALSPKECELCQKTFKSCKELSRHKLRDHKLRVHICHMCGKNFAYGHALKSHLDAHAGVKKHFCEICGEGFVRMTSLCGHRVSAHSKSKKDDVLYKCNICESVFNTRSLLKKHLVESHFTGPYAVKDYRKQKSMSQDPNCVICRSAGENTVPCPCPIHSVENKKQFVCIHCGKKFSKSHYLKAHEKQHREAKFSCDICCKRFTYKCNLKSHMSTHSADKPFQCNVCSKKFRLKFLLDEHQRTHNRDLLFKCYVCGRGLTRIPNLKRHIRVVHPEVHFEPHKIDSVEHGNS